MCTERGLWGAVHTRNVSGNYVIWRQAEINDLIGMNAVLGKADSQEESVIGGFR